MCYYHLLYFQGCYDVQFGPLAKHCSPKWCHKDHGDSLGFCTEEACMATTCCDEMVPAEEIAGLARKGLCRTCREFMIKDERRIVGEINLKKVNIRELEGRLLGNKQQGIREGRNTSAIELDMIQTEEMIQKFEKGILFLAEGSKSKDLLVADFLQHTENRRVQMEVRLLNTHLTVFMEMRKKCWAIIENRLDP